MQLAGSQGLLKYYIYDVLPKAIPVNPHSKVKILILTSGSLELLSEIMSINRKGHFT